MMRHVLPMPRGVRVAGLALATAVLLVGLRALEAQPSSTARFFDPFQQAGFVTVVGGFIGVLAVFELMRRGAPASWWGAGALALALVMALAMGYMWSPVTGWRRDWAFIGFDIARWLLVLSPVAILGVYALRSKAFAVAGLALVAFLLLAGPSPFIASSIQRGTYDRAWDDFNSNISLWRWAIGVSLLALGGSVGVTAWRAPAAPPEAVDVERAQSRKPSGLLVAGVVLMGLAWLLGGSALPSLVPFWILGLGLIALPPLARGRRVWRPALAVLLLVAVGLVPWIGCTTTYWTDAGDPPAPTHERVGLLSLAAHGPLWAEGGGFTGSTTDCSTWGIILAGAWLLALIASAWWSQQTQRRRERTTDDTEVLGREGYGSHEAR